MSTTTTTITTADGWIEDTLVPTNPVVKIGMVASGGIISVYTRRQDGTLEAYYRGRSDRKAAAVIANLSAVHDLEF